MAKILVTGGAGFIGSATVARLKHAGHTVVVFDNLENACAARIPADVGFIQADVRDSEAVLAACRGVDAIIHLAALVSVPLSLEDPDRFDAVNVTGTRHVLAASRAQGIRRVVLASTAALYGPDAPLPWDEGIVPAPRTPYATGKWQNEKDAAQFVRDGAGEAICLRFFNVYGPGQSADAPYSGAIAKALIAAKHGLPFTIYGDGEQSRDFVHVDDVARAIEMALFAPAGGGGQFNVATGRSVTLNETLAMLEAVGGREMQVSYGPARGGDIKYSSAAVRAIRDRFGFEAQIPLEDGLRRTWHDVANPH